MSLRYLIDTNVLVYVHDQGDAVKRARATDVLRRVRAARVGALAAQVLAEFASMALKKLKPPLSPSAIDVRIDGYERAFPAARGLDRAALETHLATVLAQREALAAQAQHHGRRRQLVPFRGALEALAAGLEAGDAKFAEAAASDGFRANLTHLGLSPDLPPAEAVAAALTTVHAEIAAIDKATAPQ